MNSLSDIAAAALTGDAARGPGNAGASRGRGEAAPEKGRGGKGRRGGPHPNGD